MYEKPGYYCKTCFKQGHTYVVCKVARQKKNETEKEKLEDLVNNAKVVKNQWKRKRRMIKVMMEAWKCN